MKIACAALAIVVNLLTATARADTHCYEFRNDSNQVVTLRFSYQPAIGNVIVEVAIDPGKTYPFDGRPWCWNLPEEVSATVTLSGAGTPQWKGALVLGNRPATAPSGTYKVGAATAGSSAPAAAAVTAAPATAAATASAAATRPTAAARSNCLANSFPDSDAYCLTDLETGIQVACGTGHTGISGTITVAHLALQCRNGRKLALTCGTTTGGRQKCDLNDHSICTDDHVRNAADYCAH